MNIVLASASPRRASLLAQLGLSFKTVVSNVDERMVDHEAPEEYVQRIADEKTLAISKDYPDDVVIGADTVAVFAGQVLGKAHTREQARQMLSVLNGQEHQVYTALVMNYAGDSYKQLVKTVVTMAHYHEALLEAYLDSGDWYGKAGACSLQGRGGLLIKTINGDLQAVVGLSFNALYQGFSALGFANEFLEKFAQPALIEEKTHA